jgi:hypothetical protein
MMVHSYRVFFTVPSIRVELYDSMFDVYESEEAARTRAASSIAFYLNKAFCGCTEKDFEVVTYPRYK